MKFFGFGKDKSAPDFKKRDTSGLRNLDSVVKSEFENKVDDYKINQELVNRTPIDLIGDKWPRQSLYHGTVYGVE